MRVLGWVVGGAWAAGLLVACGGSSGGGGAAAGTDAAGAMAGTSSGAGAGAAGGSAADGGVVGTGDAGDGLADGGGPSTGALSELGACVAYVRAACERRAECNGVAVTEDTCKDDLVACPDKVFSPGSARTVEGMLACAAEFKTFPCGDAIVGNVPACVTAGTRKAGETCLYPNQCESLSCPTGGDAAHPMCGVCERLLATGESCGQAGTRCPVNFDCSTSTGLCVARPPGTLPTPLVFPGVGETCDAGQCAAGLLCADDPSMTGEPGTCQTIPGDGEPCGLERDGQPEVPYSRACSESTFCDADQKCTTRPEAGSACALSLYDAFIGGMASTCEVNAQCTSGMCVALPTVVGEGASCATPATSCGIGTHCESDVCVSDGLQGLFAAACGM